MEVSWIKSSVCIAGDCVEVALADDVVLVRDSKQPDRPALRFDVDAWRSVLAALRGGDLPAGVFKRLDDGGWDWVQSTTSGTAKLTFTDDEFLAFDAGVWRSEFDVERLAAGTYSGEWGS